MSGVYAGRSAGRHAAAPRAADWLCLAAAPGFAIMALLTGVLGGSQPDIICSAAQHTSPLSGMTPMYVLMSAFHSPPWLKLIMRFAKYPVSSANRRPGDALSAANPTPR